MNCDICENGCKIENELFGRCGMYKFVNGRVEERFKSPLSMINVGYVEEAPFYHFYPGSRSLLLGTVSCNFDCKYCSNVYPARKSVEDLFIYHLTSSDVALKAKATSCHNIIFSKNEPTVSMDYFIDIAKKSDVPVGCATNGYFTRNTAKKIAKNVEFINISLKGFTDDVYREICGVDSVEPVLKNIEYLNDKIHLEVTTPIIPKLNDEEVPDMVEYISSVNENIPWHIFRLLPIYKMEGWKHPKIEYMKEILKNARNTLNYVYFGNFVGSKWEDTVCPNCGKTLIKRVNIGECGCKPSYFELTPDNRCNSCDTKINITGGPRDFCTGFKRGYDE